MDKVLEVIDLSLLLDKIAIKGAPPESIQRLGVAVLSAKYMKDFNIRLGQPLRLTKLPSIDSTISSVEQEESLNVALERVHLFDEPSDRNISCATYPSPQFLLSIAWPLSFLPDNVIALDSFSCFLLFMTAYQKQVIKDTTLEVALRVKKEMGRKTLLPSTPVSGKKKHKSPKVQPNKEENISIGVCMSHVYSEEEHGRIAATVFCCIAGFGPPSVDGQLEPVDSDRLEKWYDDVHFESYIRNIVSKRYIVPGCWICVSMEGRDLYLVCHRILPFEDRKWNEDNDRNAVWKVVKNTQIEWLPLVQADNKRTKLIALGGLDEQMNKMKSFLSSCCESEEYREQLSRLGIRPSRGILLYGPPGTGKSTLAQVVASSMQVRCVRTVRAPWIVSSTFGETESTLMEIFQQVGDRVPSILIIDEIDALGVSRDSQFATEAELRLTGSLLRCIDQMPKRMVLIGTTHRLDALDAALRRPGRLDMELEVSVPNSCQRCSILREIIKSSTSLRDEKGMTWQVELTDDDLLEVANDLHGYVGADILALWRESCYLAYKRWKQGKALECRAISVLKEDLQEARKEIFPSAMREIVVEVAQVCWDDIGGYHQVKQQLREAVEWPKKYAHYFRRFGISPIKGILLYGPPGCSKTLMAKALANETNCHFLSVKGPELFQKWVGESEKAVRNLFRKAKSVAPCIIFFDEIDALASRRQEEQNSSHAEQRVLAQLLTEMDGIASSGLMSRVDEEMEESWIFVLGATNRPDLLDPALIRPGRFDRLVYVGLPDSEAREQILKIHCRSIPLNDSSMDWKSLVELTQGMTGAD
ncbi:AAA-type ATPase [Galdieria sulphuraria]|uniref:AAA-type ATPase n=1 Tax=Galdieria sulphuraria TaxID=130081 RepID=M2VZR7_GALSU|nr:AAA-type ATPase [Galdieria sulphuraria]EME28831.1 AAA-type ATPase [Galdieria sulphuraria]|eukprot:XP_005705351.1 AAA-type ATPase [Galdieria sulphuraria]